MASFEAVRADYAKANRARQMIDESITSFHAATIVGDEDRAETERQRAHDALDAFFDGLAAAHREMNRSAS